MRTRSTAKKRFSFTKTGRIKRSKAYRRHLLTKKSQKRKRDLRGVAYVSECDVRAIIRMFA